MLHACLAATKKSLDRCLARPISDYFTFCVVDIATMDVSCSVMFKLSLADEVGWDLDVIRRDFSFKDYFERFRINLEQVGLAIDQSQSGPCKPSFFTTGTMKMSKVKTWYEAKLAKDSQVTADGLSRDLVEFLSVDDMGFFGDRFWEDFMVDGGII